MENDQLFAVEYSANISLSLFDDQFDTEDSWPDQEFLSKNIPDLFKISGSNDNVDYTLMKSLKEYGDEFGDLGKIINEQAQRINMLVTLLLSSDPYYKTSIKTMKISGNELFFSSLGEKDNSSISIEQNEVVAQLEVGKKVSLKIYLIEFYLAVFCYAEVINISTDENDPNKKIYTLKYQVIRPEDREKITQATFKIQTNMLRVKSNKKYEHIS